MFRCWAICAVAIVLIWSVDCFADDQSDVRDKSEDQSSLDKQLLNELDNDLLKGLDDVPPKRPQGGGNNGERPPGDDGGGKRPPPDRIGAGEDIAPGRQSDPIREIGKRMRAIERLFRQRDTSTETQQRQEEILDELAKLIRIQKSKKPQSKKQRSRPRSAAHRNQTSSVGDQPRQNEGAQKSTPRVGKPEDTAGDSATNIELLLDIWNAHLPERVRNQMRGTNVEEFLPKYELLIRQYFERLAEDDDF